jgi:hypothetical protein
MEADAPNPSGGAPVHYIIDGKLANGSMSGSWNHGATKAISHSPRNRFTDCLDGSVTTACMTPTGVSMPDTTAASWMWARRGTARCGGRWTPEGTRLVIQS